MTEDTHQFFWEIISLSNKRQLFFFYPSPVPDLWHSWYIEIGEQNPKSVESNEASLRGNKREISGLSETDL